VGHTRQPVDRRDIVAVKHARRVRPRHVRGFRKFTGANATKRHGVNYLLNDAVGHFRNLALLTIRHYCTPYDTVRVVGRLVPAPPVGLEESASCANANSSTVLQMCHRRTVVPAIGRIARVRWLAISMDCADLWKSGPRRAWPARMGPVARP